MIISYQHYRRVGVGVMAASTSGVTVVAWRYKMKTGSGVHYHAVFAFPLWRKVMAHHSENKSMVGERNYNNACLWIYHDLPLPTCRQHHWQRRAVYYSNGGRKIDIETSLRAEGVACVAIGKRTHLEKWSLFAWALIWHSNNLYWWRVRAGVHGGITGHRGKSGAGRWKENGVVWRAFHRVTIKSNVVAVAGTYKWAWTPRGVVMRIAVFISRRNILS